MQAASMREIIRSTDTNYGAPCWRRPLKEIAFFLPFRSGLLKEIEKRSALDNALFVENISLKSDVWADGHMGEVRRRRKV